jgi:hypothetical protein
MSSLDMGNPSGFINATREPGEPELLHKNFLAKVPNVLGYSVSAKFLAHTNVPIGMHGQTRQSPVYNLPRREAILMAMPYSYKLQEMVLDACNRANSVYRGGN